MSDTEEDAIIADLYRQAYLNGVDREKYMELWSKQVRRLLAEVRKDERNQVALDNYRGQTISDSTNWKGRFDKFIQNNEKRLEQLAALGGKSDE